MAEIWGAAIVAGATVATGAYSARQAGRAADAQGRASSDAIAAQQESERRALEMQQPFYEAGYAATAAMMDMAGLDRSRLHGSPTGGTFDVAEYRRQNPDVANDGYFGSRAEEHWERHGRAEGRARPVVGGTATSDLSSYDQYDWKTDPGYRFRMDEGMKAIERSAAARGVLGSGGTLRGATRFAQDYASNEYQRVFDRISSIAGRGQSAASQGSNIIVGTGQGVGSALINAGEARASGYVAQGNAWTNAINQGAALYGSGAFGGIGGLGSDQGPGAWGSSTGIPGTMYGSGGYIYNVP